MRRFLAALAATAMLACANASAQEESTWDAFKGHVAHNWSESKRAWSDGDWTLYLTGYTWHLPYAWSAQQRAEQNSLAWGGGLGRYVWDEKGNYHGLYAIAFSDSHYKPEYQFGYNWQTYWGSGNLKVGLGYTVFLWMRSDIANYFPLPGILPLASIRYSKAEIMGTFVPSFGDGNGSIAFFFGRIDF